MMTFMELPMHSMMGGDANANTTSSNADSDDARFLDGLFERLSGSSDNGSDKGKDEGSRNFNSNAMQGSASSTRTGTRSNSLIDGGILNTAPHGSLGTLNLNGQYLKATPGVTNTQGCNIGVGAGVTDLSSMTNSSSHTNSSVSQLPQHLMYAPDNNTATFLPQNLLNQHEQQQQQQKQQTFVQPKPQVQAQVRHQMHQQTHQQLSSNAAQLAHLGVQQFNSWINTPAAAPAQMQAPSPPNVLSNSISIPTHIQNQVLVAASNQIPILNHAPPAPVPIPMNHVQSMHVPDMIMSAPDPSRKRGRSSTTPVNTSASSDTFACSISDDEGGDSEKRRRDRNLREQERSQRIATQISDLKSLLAKSNVAFKPDKFSTLVSVHTYIKNLQERSCLLDAEQKKLVTTITQSNDLVNKSQHGPQAVPHSSGSNDVAIVTASGHAIIPSNSIQSDEDELLVFVRGLDYKNIFTSVRIPLCVTSIDGRLIDCNEEFIRTCNVSREILVSSGLRPATPGNSEEMNEAGKNPLSLFNLVAKEDMQKVFTTMGSMLKTIHKKSSGGTVPDMDYVSKIRSDHWSSEIRFCHKSSEKVSSVHYTFYTSFTISMQTTTNKPSFPSFTFTVANQHQFSTHQARNSKIFQRSPDYCLITSSTPVKN